MKPFFKVDLFTLHEPSEVEKSFCYACCELISGQAYFCSDGSDQYWLHEELCSKLPPQIEHPLHSQHRLNLLPHDSKQFFSSRVSGPICNRCGYYSPFTFNCEEGCSLRLCVKCAFDPRASLEELRGSRKLSLDVHHSIHQHSLVACKAIQPGNFPCKCCMRSTYDSYYICTDCRFYVHKSCIESLTKLPHNMRHPLHSRHPLTLLHETDFFICNDCRDLCHGLRFSCKSCRFNVDIKCGSLLKDYFSEHDLALEKPNAEARIDHFCHPHTLKHCNIDHLNNIEVRVDCCYCNQKIIGSNYVCLDCDFFIHELCIYEIQQQVRHQYHSNHTLSAHVIGKDFEGKCNACKGDMAGVILRCQRCNFNLHYSCAKRNHQRPLTDKFHEHNLFYFKHDDLSSTALQTCCTHHQGDLKSSCYRCVECDVNLHLECMPMLHIDKVKCYGDHLLKLVDSTNGYDFEEYYCDVCEEIGTTNHHLYYCEECIYLAHIDCIVTKTSEVSRDMDIIHFIHQHPLILCYLSERRKYNCRYCNQKIFGLHHVCIDCKFFIHESCRDQMKENEGIECLYHPQHPLFVFFNHHKYGRICNACRRQILDIGLWCEDCNFGLHSECSVKPIPRPLKLQFHKHNLFYFDELPMVIGYCDICHRGVFQSSIYHCFECDINTRFHLKCILDMLPLVEVKSRNLTLTLSASATKNNFEEYFCGVCKEKGNTKDPHYYSEECTYFAHIECVIMENDISWMCSRRGDKLLRTNDTEEKACGVHNMAIIKYEGNPVLENLRSEDKAKNYINMEENNGKWEEVDEDEDEDEDAKESGFEQLQQDPIKETISKVEINAWLESDTNQESHNTPFELDVEVSNFCAEMDALVIKLEAIKGRQSRKIQSIILSCREKLMEL